MSSSATRRDTATPQAASAQACAQAVLSCVPEVMREIRHAMRRAAPEGLTVPQLRTLIFAQRQPGNSVGDLAAHLGVTLPTASVTVSNLAERRLLEVVAAADDKRRRAIRLSPAGAAVVDAAWAQTAADFAARLGAVPSPQLEAMRGALLTLSACLNPLP